MQNGLNSYWGNRDVGRYSVLWIPAVSWFVIHSIPDGHKIFITRIGILFHSFYDF
jgi:hypothetical protein